MEIKELEQYQQELRDKLQTLSVEWDSYISQFTAEFHIKKGDKVKVDNREIGIFNGFSYDRFVGNFSTPRPVVFKLKKDGTASKNTIYCWNIKSITKFEE